jgi:hypothetical protein
MHRRRLYNEAVIGERRLSPLQKQIFDRVVRRLKMFGTTGFLGRRCNDGYHQRAVIVGL